MKLVIFGLSVSSSWGEQSRHSLRGLIQALTRLGHRVVFYERDVPYYAEHRDLPELPGGDLRLYPRWQEVAGRASIDVGTLHGYREAIQVLSGGPVAGAEALA
jgi:spore maturation protein CgeB